jgi:hypothetical protein
VAAAGPGVQRGNRPRDKEHVMKNRLLVATGIVVIIGAVFALQGFGVIGGSAVSNNHTFVTYFTRVRPSLCGTTAVVTSSSNC